MLLHISYSSLSNLVEKGLQVVYLVIILRYNITLQKLCRKFLHAFVESLPSAYKYVMIWMPILKKSSKDEASLNENINGNVRVCDNREIKPYEIHIKR